MCLSCNLNRKPTQGLLPWSANSGNIKDFTEILGTSCQDVQGPKNIYGGSYSL